MFGRTHGIASMLCAERGMGNTWCVRRRFYFLVLLKHLFLSFFLLNNLTHCLYPLFVHLLGHFLSSDRRSHLPRGVLEALLSRNGHAMDFGSKNHGQTAGRDSGFDTLIPGTLSTQSPSSESDCPGRESEVRSIIGLVIFVEI